MGEAYAGYKLLRVELRVSGVCVCTFTGDHASGTNILTLGLFRELDRFARQAEADDNVRVIVVRSSSSEFWIPHFCVETILSFPADRSGEGPKKGERLGFVSGVAERMRAMGKPTIAEVVGRVGGGGCELAAGFDMRFGVHGRTFVSQQEVGIGCLAGAGGCVRWPELAGRGRAMEVLLGAVDLDAATAESWGFLNRAFPTSESCSAYVDWLADRMASFPKEALRLTKRAVDYGLECRGPGGSREDALLEEAWYFGQLLRLEEPRALMRRFVERGGQTREHELLPDALIASKL